MSTRAFRNSQRAGTGEAALSRCSCAETKSTRRKSGWPPGNAAAPAITDAQRAFVTGSEEAEVKRLGKERAQLEAIGRAQDATAQQQRRAARLQRRIWWLLGGVAALVLAMVGYVTWQSYDVARREINVFTARAAEALNDEKFDLAMRYALQAYPARGQLPGPRHFPLN